jgi:hypothetical protein
MSTKSTLKTASLGSISTATLRTEDLLNAFLHELEWQIQRNGEYFSQPENFPQRDRLNGILGQAQDCFADNGEIYTEQEALADELVNETLPDALSTFAAPYCYFGAHPGDGADFGFWLSDVEDIKEQVEFCSSVDQEYPDDDFTGEWLHINERGNCTLYVRENGKDSEVWSIV